MSFDIEAMRADAADGTLGPWEFRDWFVIAGREDICEIYIDTSEYETPAESPRGSANARRIARVPNMEAEIERLTAENARLRDGLKRVALAGTFNAARYAAHFAMEPRP